MYEAFYEFSETPFSRTIPTDRLYRGSNTDEMLDRLKHAAKRQHFAVLTGDCGTGKTTLLRLFHDELDNSAYKVLYLSDSKLTPRMFYRGLLEQLGFEPRFARGDAKHMLHREIELMRAVHHLNAVVIVDEAHLLDRDMLEEVRFLLNVKMDSLSPMALILSGQSELRDKLKLQSYAAIRQRVDMHCSIDRLERAQVTQYVQAHMRYAGCNKDIFSEAAIDEIYQFSGGIPRLINKVCTCALLYGAQNRKNILDDHIVKLVVECEMC